MLIGAIILTAIENMPFNLIIYEAASAIGTVGLSTGITPKITPAGKVILMICASGEIGLADLFPTTQPAEIMGALSVDKSSADDPQQQA